MMVEIEKRDRLPVWHLCRSADMPRYELMPLLNSLGFTIEADTQTGDMYASRAEFGDFLRSTAGGAV